jgi:hypothetical protein
VADPGQRVSLRIDGAKHVEINEAVVERRDQGDRHRMRALHEIGVRAGRINQHEIMAVFDLGDGVCEGREFRRLVLVGTHPFDTVDIEMGWPFQIETVALRPGSAVLDVMGEAVLTRVEVDGGDPLAGLQ